MTLDSSPPEPSESTPEQPVEAVAARHGTRPASEPASTERTPEERLLARRRLGSNYLEDVRSLIAERDAAKELAAYWRDRYNVLEAAKDADAGERPRTRRDFGSIATRRLEGE